MWLMVKELNLYNPISDRLIPVITELMGPHKETEKSIICFIPPKNCNQFHNVT